MNMETKHYLDEQDIAHFQEVARSDLGTSPNNRHMIMNCGICNPTFIIKFTPEEAAKIKAFYLEDIGDEVEAIEYSKKEEIDLVDYDTYLNMELINPRKDIDGWIEEKEEVSKEAVNIAIEEYLEITTELEGQYRQDRCKHEHKIKHDIRAYRDGKRQMYKCTECGYIKKGKLIKTVEEAK